MHVRNLIATNVYLQHFLEYVFLIKTNSIKPSTPRTSGTQTELTLVADNLLDSDQGTVVPVITGGDQTGGAGSANLVAAQDLCKVIIVTSTHLQINPKPNDKTPHAKSNFAFPVRSSNGRVRLAPLPYPPIAFPWRVSRQLVRKTGVAEEPGSNLVIIEHFNENYCLHCFVRLS